MSCEAPYGGGRPTCTVPTTPVVTVKPNIGTPVHNDLPFTGGDVVGGLLLGIGAIVGGIALVRSGRRKAA